VGARPTSRRALELKLTNVGRAVIDKCHLELHSKHLVSIVCNNCDCIVTLLLEE
jgi:hypothetical protein